MSQIITPTQDRHAVRAGIASGAGAGALWGFAVLAPALLPEFSPVQIAAGRYLVYGLLSVVLIAPRWRTIAAGLARRDWLALFRLALFGNILFYIGVAAATHHGGVAMTALVLGFLPVIVTIVGSRDAGAVRLGKLIPSLLLGVAGAACISWQTLTTASAPGNPVFGLLAAIGALASWSLYAVGNARCLARLSCLSGHDWNLLTGLMTGLQALLLIPVSVATDRLSHGADAWMALAAVSVGLAVVASMAGNVLWNRMSRLLPLTMVGQMFLFETLFALVYGFLWDGRWPHPFEIAAFALVVGSVLACIAAHRRRSETRQFDDPATA